MPAAHVKGFDSGMDMEKAVKESLGRLLGYNVLVFDGVCRPDETGFTAVPLAFMKKRKSNFVVAFVPSSQVASFTNDWASVKEKFGDQLKIVEIDVTAAKAKYGL